MRFHLEPAPWTEEKPHSLVPELRTVLNGAWAAAAVDYYALRTAAKAAKTRAPKGIQPMLNRQITSRFAEADWDYYGARFLKNGLWVRITFRHQMSLGSDILDAFKAIQKGHAEQAIIMSADLPFLRLITPNDASALCSYEKFRAAIRDLSGCMQVPLFLARLEPKSPLPIDVARDLQSSRPRDTTAPSE